MPNTEPLLTKQEMTELKARAHHLNPVVMVGQKGLTDAVIAETRQALHARTLGFVHPTTGEQMDFTSPLPQDMEQLLDKWRNYIKGLAV